MPIRNAVSYTFRPLSLSDAVDGTNIAPGAMLALQNLAPSQTMRGVFVPRVPAAQLVDFSADFTTPTNVTVMLVVGRRIYGMVSSADHTGKDMPFAWDLDTTAFVPVTITADEALPSTVATAGEWAPPTMAFFPGRIIVTHPGFAGGAGPYFGWIDISSFSDTAKTGSTHSNTTVDTLSANVLLAGWQPGYAISGTGIPANTHIVAIASGGLSLTLSQAATATAAGVALSVTGGTPATPLWGSGNCNLHPLVGVPSWVFQFNGRAWYGVAEAAVATDVGFPCTRTNDTYALRFLNGLPVTAVGGLGLSTPLTGGIVQAMILFQADQNLIQVTGDFSSTISVQSLNVPTGTLAPRSVCPVIQGLAFVSPDGLRVIDANASVSDPIGLSGAGVITPFLNIVRPSRMAAAYGEGVIRISLFNGDKTGEPAEEYWFDIVRKVWTGPHTLPASDYVFLETNAPGFLMVPMAPEAAIFAGTTIAKPDIPDPAESFIEKGAELTWRYETSLLPDNARSAMNLVIESTISLALQPQQVVNLTVEDDVGKDIASVQIKSRSEETAIWDQVTWDQFKWAGASTALAQYRISPAEPVVFKQAKFIATGISKRNTGIGDIFMKFSPLGYVI